MKRVLILGAGLSCGPLVRYLLDYGDIEVTVADADPARARAYIGGHGRGTSIALDVHDTAALRPLVASHDLVVSFLPSGLHRGIAKLALENGKHFLCPSNSSRIGDFDGEARRRRLVFFTECGLDPGIDHMAAMRLIHTVKERGGKITSYASYCGGLPAPDANTNPWGYKFSWSPLDTLVMARTGARYLRDGEEVELPGEELFSRHWPVTVPGFGELEAHYNGDCLPCAGLYGLEDVRDFFRATLRYYGWSFNMGQLAGLGYLDLKELDAPPATYAGLTRRLAGLAPTTDLKPELARRLDVAEGSETMVWLEWLGLTTEEPLRFLPGAAHSPLDALVGVMLEKMSFAPGERDLTVLHSEVRAEYPSGKAERRMVTLIVYGEPDGYSAMARTVGLPSAIAVTMILDGRIAEPGVLLPVSPAVYEPILEELARQGIVCRERSEPVAVSPLVVAGVPEDH